MHFYLLRRHRRPLFFPPGLLALAGLLWLGSVVIGPWKERLRQKYVLQLFFPPKPTSDTIFAGFDRGYVVEGDMLRRYKCKGGLVLYSQLHDNEICDWQDIVFDGDPAHDSASLKKISSTIKSMRADALPKGGIRVNFLPKAPYSTLVKLIDVMNTSDQGQYIIDMNHEPLAVYIIVDKPDLKCVMVEEMLRPPY